MVATVKRACRKLHHTFAAASSKVARKHSGAHPVDCPGARGNVEAANATRSVSLATRNAATSGGGPFRVSVGPRVHARLFHQAQEARGWFDPTPPSFAARPVWQEHQQPSSEAAEQQQADGGQQADMEPRLKIVRKNYSLTSNPLYRYANIGVLESLKAGELQLLPSKVHDALKSYVSLGSSSNSSGDKGQHAGADKLGQKGKGVTKPKLSARQALLSYARLG